MAKKLISIMLVVVSLVFAFASCGGDDDTTDTEHTHAFGEWETVRSATCVAVGEKERYCSCGEKQTAAISVTAHNYVNGTCTVCQAKENGDNNAPSDEDKYNSACALIESCQYEEAYDILMEIADYAPAQEKLKNFYYAPTVRNESSVVHPQGGEQYIKTETTTYEYDKYGNLVRITTENGDSYEFTYDSKRNMLSGYILDSYYRVRTQIFHTYSGGKLISSVYGTGKSISYTYDDVGKLVKKIDNGNEINYTYTYDGNGNVETVSYIDDGNVVEMYGENGALINKTISYGSDSLAFNMLYENGLLMYIDVVFTMEGETMTFRFTYIYGTNNELIQFTPASDAIDFESVSFSGHKLFYSENPGTADIISRITCTNPDIIFSFFN